MHVRDLAAGVAYRGTYPAAAAAFSDGIIYVCGEASFRLLFT